MRLRRLHFCVLAAATMTLLAGLAYVSRTPRPTKPHSLEAARSRSLPRRVQPIPSAPPPSTSVTESTSHQQDSLATALALVETDLIDPIDLDWERRLSEKPEAVVRFFLQSTATFGEWARAYREDLCACSNLHCVTALQDDFNSRAPELTDTRQDDTAREELRAAIACAARHQARPAERAGLTLEEAAALRAALVTSQPN